MCVCTCLGRVYALECAVFLGVCICSDGEVEIRMFLHVFEHICSVNVTRVYSRDFQSAIGGKEFWLMLRDCTDRNPQSLRADRMLGTASCPFLPLGVLVGSEITAYRDRGQQACVLRDWSKSLDRALESRGRGV